MIALWMLYASLVGLGFGLAALALERGAVLWAKPRRFVWAAAVAASLLTPVAALTIRRVPVPQPTGPGSLLIEGIVAGPQPVARAPAAGGTGASSRIGQRIEALNPPLLMLWGAASLVLAVGLLRAAIRLRRRARGWRAATVDGTEVLVAPDLGPAVVRLGGLEVVLPEWALSAEPAARSLMLLHEVEHRRAHDPDLLLAATVALVLAPWAPPLWWLVRRLQLAIETDCDRRVMRAGADARAYGVLLIRVGARSTIEPLLAPTAFSEARTLLERRIEAMTPPSPRWRLVRTALVTGAGAVIVAAACVTPRPAPAPASQAERVYSEDSVTDRPVLLAHPPIKYPDSLKAAGLSGRVLIEAVIDTTGHADSASVRIVSSSLPAFEAPSREVVLASTFRPGRLDGRAVPVRVRMPLNYTVASGPATALPPGVYAERSVSEPPRLLNRPEPRYPDSLRTSGTFGSAVVVAVVDSIGHVDPASVRVQWSSSPGFEAPAREAVAASSYTAGRLNGRAVPVMIVVQLRWIPPAEYLRGRR